MTFVRSIFLAASLTGFAIGCGSGAESTASPAPEATDDLVTITAVHVNRDGTMTVKSAKMTRADERAERLAVHPWMAYGSDQKDFAPPTQMLPPGNSSGGSSGGAPIFTDSGCAHEDLWLYDGIWDVGHRLCIGGTGIADLSQIPHWFCPKGSRFCFVGTWAGAVRSYIPGEFGGELFGNSGSESFTPWSGVSNTGAAGSAADHVALGL
jgi:hypothetical protein